MKALRALIVEDSDDDTELLARELRRAGFDLEYCRVDTPESLSAQLRTGRWDIVFSDFTMPRFNAFDALSLLRDSGLDLPFIIVSGTIGEDRAVTAMKAGAHDYILKDNLKRLAPAVDRELREAHVRRERRAADETIRRLAYIDPVTELPNRLRFRTQAQEAAWQARTGEQVLAMMVMDLDRFQEVNDTLGHSRGDQLLRQVGLRLRGALFVTDVVARLGGDEFGILLPCLARRADLLPVIAKLQEFLQAPFMIDGIPIAVEASIGVALMPDHAADVDTLMQQADIAMYRAKRTTSSYVIYAPELKQHSHERLGLMAELRDAIERDQLLLHFQPKGCIDTRHVAGTEALVRWQHPRHGLLAPERFITMAEHTGLIVPLSEWVLRRALGECRQARAAAIHLQVSVNLSARSLHDPRLPDIVANELASADCPPEQLTLEITESAIVLDPPRAESTLTTLSSMGVRISIDDFGTGYTSLASIRHLPVDEIKIDKSFVTDMLTNKRDAMIVRSVIELGHNLGLRVVAEGVENEATLDALALLECDEAQGYFISHPQDFGALLSWLATASWRPVPNP
ncbi:MAG: EAL domain-containing protein [Gammaproteobacteria bacterium]|nr:EAL domain-containing protein [Gammaproteobacteria bacterium]